MQIKKKKNILAPILTDFLKSKQSTENVQAAIEEICAAFLDDAKSSDDVENLLSKYQLQEASTIKIFRKLVGDAESLDRFRAKILRPLMKLTIFNSLQLKSQSKQIKTIIKKELQEFKGENLVQMIERLVYLKYQQRDQQVIDEIYDSLLQLSEEVQNPKFWKDRPFIQPPIQLQEKIQVLPAKIEQLKNLKADYSKYPPNSIEKMLQRQIIIHFQMNYNAKENEIFESNLQEIRVKYNQEFKYVDKQVERMFQNCIQKKQKIYENLCLLKKKIMPINVLECQRLILKTQQSKKEIEGQNVFFLIGATGAGKSTSILRFLGYDLKKVIFNGKLPTFVPIKELQEKHKSFLTSPESASCTRYINAVELPKEAFPQGEVDKREKWFICDSPGLWDSGGIQIQIANCVGMINALYGCKSLRMVWLLPRDSLTHQKNSGAVKISQTMSKFIESMKGQVSKSMFLLFTKFNTDEQRKFFSNQMESKLNNLTAAEAADDKVSTFLNMIRDAAKNKQNFLDPIHSDFKSLLGKIKGLAPINDVKNRIRYNYTPQTYKQIQIFCGFEHRRTLEKLQRQQYQQAHFHLQMIKILKNHLGLSNVTQSYVQSVKYITKQATEMFLTLQSLYKQVLERGTQQKYQKIKILQANVAQLHKNFSQLKISDQNNVTQYRLDAIKKIAQKIADIQKLQLSQSNRLICCIKDFSQNLDPSLKQSVLTELTQKFQQKSKQITTKISNNMFDSLNSSIKILINLKQNLSLLQNSNTLNLTIQNIQKNLASIVNSRVNQALLEIKNSQNSGEIEKFNQNLAVIEQIQTIDILNEHKKITNMKNELLLQAEAKCRYCLQQLRSILKEDDFEAGTGRKLANKKQEITNLLTIKPIQQKLKYQFDINIKIMAKKLRDNVEQLRQTLQNLQNKSLQQKQQNINKIRKAMTFVRKCSQALGNSIEGQQIIKKICEWFQDYLKDQEKIFTNLNIRSGRLSLQTYNKIEESEKKIRLFKKIGQIQQNIKSQLLPVEQIFYKQLTEPFVRCENSDLTKIEEQYGYKNLHYSLGQFQILLEYSHKLKEILISSQFEKITTILRDKILPAFNKKINLLFDDSQLLIHGDYFQKQQNEKRLKCLVQNMLAIRQKPYTREQITKFQIQKLILDVQKRLAQTQQDINQKFEEFKKSDFNTKISGLQSLRIKCRSYHSIQKMLRGPDSTLFKKLMQTITEEAQRQLEKTQESAKSLFIGGKPSYINFRQIKEYYESFNQMKHQNKKRMIIDELQKILTQKKHNLEEIRNQLSYYHSEIIQEGRLFNILQDFNQAAILQARLRQIFIKEDLDQLIVNHTVLNIVQQQLIKNIKDFFQKIKQNLAKLSLAGIQPKIANFGKIEAALMKIKQSLSQEGKTEITSFIQSAKKQLSQLIRQFSQSKDIVIYIQRQTLRTLLNSLLSQVNLYIKKKYRNGNYKQIVIDEVFISYYQSQKKQGRQSQIKEEISNYFKDIFEQLKALNITESKIKQLNKKLDNSIQNLPLPLKNEISSKRVENEKEIIKVNSQFISSLTINIESNDQQFQKFFNELNKAFKQSSDGLHQRLINKFEVMCEEKSLASKNLVQRINFIRKYLVKNFKNFKEMILEDQAIKKKLNNIFNEEFKILVSTSKQILQKLQKIIASDHLKNDQNQENEIKASIQEGFSILSILFQADYDLFDNSSYYKKLIINTFSQNLPYIAKVYKQRLALKPQIVSFASPDTLDSEKIKSLQDFLFGVEASGKIVDEIKSILKNFNFDSEQAELKAQKQSFLKLADYREKFVAYKEQIKSMTQNIKSFEFNNEIKKNWTEKEITQDLIKLDTMLQILRQRQDFINTVIIKDKLESFNFSRLEKTISEQYEKLFNKSQEQVTNIFLDYNYTQSISLNVFISITRIAMEKKMNFVQHIVLSTKYKHLIERLKSSFEAIQNQCVQSLTSALEIKAQIEKEIQEDNKQRDIQIYDSKLQLSKQKQNKSKSLINQIDLVIANETDEANKDALQKKKKVQLNSIDKQIDLALQEQLDRISKKHEDILAQKRSSLCPFLSKLVENLILYKKAALDITYDSKRQNDNLEAIIDTIPKGGSKFVSLLIDALQNNEKDKNNLGKVLLNSYKVFSSYVIKIRNREVKGSDIKYVMQHVRALQANMKVKLQKQELDTIAREFKNFQEQFEQIKQMYLKQPEKSTIFTVANICRDLGKRLKDDEYFYGQQDSSLKIPLLASIFGLWTIMKAEKYEKQIEFPVQPHPTQITTLILLLGISKVVPRLQNRLAQVGTGEGKSIVLAGLSCYLSLVGFQVRCACYSSYLSVRDQENFRQLFQILHIQNQVKYGTFNELCEDILNRDSNFKQEVYKLLLRPDGMMQRYLGFLGFGKININLQSEQKTILIIDEVDVFFEGNFFGKSYCPAITLRDPSIKNLLEYVWQQVQKNRDHFALENINKIFDSQQFRAVVNRFRCLQPILKNQVHGMVSGAFSYKHDYFIVDNKIAYKDNDSISPSLSYGYKTVFANLYEYKRGNVSKLSYENALEISLAIAEFSYALLPGYFRNIIGVTGTLQVMPAFKKLQLKNRYQVTQQFIIPSAFGMQRKREQMYFIVESSQFYDKIIERIQTVTDRRPIIVFFKTAKELNEFACCPQYEKFLPRTFNLTEEHHASVRDARIIRATNAFIITLMTNSFGRGTDFILFGKEIKQTGGLHVIQTFISHDQSQEVQIKGRTARQSNRGSYDCIINESTLEEIGLNAQNVPKDASSDTIHQLLFEGREKNMQKLSDSTLAQLEQSDRKHAKTLEIFDRENLSQAEIVRYIGELNGYPQLRDTNVRTILGLDATGSMSKALARTCSIIGEAFTRAYEVLKQEKVQGTFQIKIVVYRNYNSNYEQVIQSTAFENTSNSLKIFLQNVQAKGGWGNEAIELFFQAANKEEKVDQLILIGDAPWNTEFQVRKKRERKGENYWNGYNLPLTTVEAELQKILAKKIPIHTFPLYAQDAFRQLSEKTGGRSSHFQVDHPLAADQLTGFVVENILKILGQKSGQTNAAERLVQTYRKLYK